MIYLNITSGIGDRFLSWQNMFEYSVQNGIDVTYLWYTQKNYGNFEDYFKFENSIIVKNYNKDKIDINNDYVDDKKWIYFFTSKIGYLSSNFINFIKNKRCNEFNCYYNPHVRKIFENIPLKKDFFQKIKPSNRIQEKLDNYIKENNFHNMIGMHIRRADHYWSIKNSPDSLFIDKIRELISIDNNIKIFLCTDSDLLKNNIVHIFPNNILTRNIKKRYSGGSMDDAVLDMFLLSKCKKIYGCDSGFSIVSSLIGGIENDILQLNICNIVTKME